MNKKLIKKLYKTNLSATAIKSLLCVVGGYGSYKAFIYGYKKYYPKENQSISLNEHGITDLTLSSSKKKNILKSDREKLLKIFRILLPSIWTKQFALVCIHTCALIIRAWLSIYVATLDGKLTKSIVEKNLMKFIILLTQWIGVAVPATFINSLLKYLEGKISLAFRTVLAKHAYNLYFDKQTYYKVGNLDSRLTAVDESLVEDLNLFCNSVSHLYSHLTKPVLDIVLIGYILIRIARKRSQSGLVPTIIAVFVTGCTGQLLKMVSPHFGKLVSEESSRRGNLRTVHSRIINNAEEIAFYGGHKVCFYSTDRTSFLSLLFYKCL